MPLSGHLEIKHLVGQFKLNFVLASLNIPSLVLPIRYLCRSYKQLRCQKSSLVHYATLHRHFLVGFPNCDDAVLVEPCVHMNQWLHYNPSGHEPCQKELHRSFRGSSDIPNDKHGICGAQGSALFGKPSSLPYVQVG